MNDDLEVPERWYLANPIDRHGRDLFGVFMEGQPVEVEGPVRVGFNPHAPKRGRPIDYAELDADIVPIVHVRVASVLSDLAPDDVQILPVEIEGHPDQYCLINVTKTVKCIDDQRSAEVQYYTPESEEVFRDFVGQYRSVIGMRIDATKVGNAKIFRPWGWPVAIIVHEQIKQAMERIGTVGVRFTEV